MTNPNENMHYLARRAALIIRLGCECRLCGTAKKLQFHHIDGNGEHGIGGWAQLRRLELEIASGEKIELLCKKCHRKEHDRLHFDLIR